MEMKKFYFHVTEFFEFEEIIKISSADEFLKFSNSQIKLEVGGVWNNFVAS